MVLCTGNKNGKKSFLPSSGGEKLFYYNYNTVNQNNHTPNTHSEMVILYTQCSAPRFFSCNNMYVLKTHPCEWL